MHMTSLRSKVIHLAHEKPELRPHLLPLLKTAAQKPGHFQDIVKWKTKVFIGIYREEKDKEVQTALDTAQQKVRENRQFLKTIETALRDWDLDVLVKHRIITQKDADNATSEMSTRQRA